MLRTRSLQRLVAVWLVLWFNLVVCQLHSTPVSPSNVDGSANSLLKDQQHVPLLTESALAHAQARASFIQDLRRRQDAATKTSSAPASTSTAANGLNGFISQIIDAFSCVGNASDILKGFENLLEGLDADTTLVNAIESALYGDYTPFQIPAFFMGIGIGQASLVGLNATNATRAKGYADSAVIASGGNNTGINNLSLEFGRGLVNVTLPAVLSSSSDDFLAGVSLAQLVEGAGIGTADGVGTVLKPILGTNFFDVSVNNTGNFSDPKGAGAIAYAFTRGLASQLTSLGLGFLGISNTSTVPMLRRRTASSGSGGRGIDEQDEVIRSFLGGQRIAGRNIRVPTPDSKFQLTDPVLLNSTKTDQITSSLAQLAVSELSCKGVGGAIAVFSSLLSDDPNSPIPTIPNLGDIHLPDIKVAVRSSGNLFEIGLKNMSATVNGNDMNKLIGLLATHIVLTIIAFLGLFPTVLIVEAIHRLAIAIKRPIDPLKLNRFLNILQVGVIPLLAIVGLILGILAGGNSQHFRTPHGILGLILVILLLVSSVLSALRRRRTSRAFTGTNHATNVKWPSLVENLVTLVVMCLIFAAWITGLEDLRTLSLCIVDQISITIMATVASLINGLWDSTLTILAVEWWLGRRLHTTVERTHETGSLGSEGGESAKEGRARHVDVLDKSARN